MKFFAASLFSKAYTSAAFITSKSQSGLQGEYATPAEDISVDRFAKVLIAHMKKFYLI